MSQVEKQVAAAKFLWAFANGYSEQSERDVAVSVIKQSKIVAKFLIWLYDGNRFPFDLTGLTGLLDTEILQDAISVLEMDSQPHQEIHEILGVDGREFEQLARTWGIKETSKTAEE